MPVRQGCCSLSFLRKQESTCAAAFLDPCFRKGDRSKPLLCSF
jgi:hypothetical protein